MTELDTKPYYKTQWANLKIITGGTEKSFGVEWLLRLILVILAFIAPGGAVKALNDKFEVVKRRKSIEFWAIAKVVFAWTAVSHGWTENQFVTWVIIILALDTVHGLLSRIFLDDLWRSPISDKRNLILAFVNYAELCLCFAAIYHYQDHQLTANQQPVFIMSDTLHTDKHISPDDAIYFSFITATTIGYGDIIPRDIFVRKVINTQSMISLIFVVLVIANLAGKIGTGKPAVSSSPKEQVPPE